MFTTNTRSGLPRIPWGHIDDGTCADARTARSRDRSRTLRQRTFWWGSTWSFLISFSFSSLHFSIFFVPPFVRRAAGNLRSIPALPALSGFFGTEELSWILVETRDSLRGYTSFSGLKSKVFSGFKKKKYVVEWFKILRLYSVPLKTKF